MEIEIIENGNSIWLWIIVIKLQLNILKYYKRVTKIIDEKYPPLPNLQMPFCSSCSRNNNDIGKLIKKRFDNIKIKL